jgi:hypothetical protein
MTDQSPKTIAGPPLSEAPGSPSLEDLIGEREDDLGPDCDACGDTGRIVAADGYHEYLGYSYLPCPHCRHGASNTCE